MILRYLSDGQHSTTMVRRVVNLAWSYGSDFTRPTSLLLAVQWSARGSGRRDPLTACPILSALSQGIFGKTGASVE